MPPPKRPVLHNDKAKCPYGRNQNTHQHRQCRHHGAVGVNWWFVQGNEHFSGNYWLASAAWLRRLPRIDSIYRDRYSCEVWIGSVKPCRAKSLICSDKRFWSVDKDYLFELRQGATSIDRPI